MISFLSRLLGLLFFCLPIINLYAEPMTHQSTIQERPRVLQVGERLTFSVRWLGMEVGKAHSYVSGIEELHGRKVYHLIAEARSNALIDLVYPVRDEHHSFLDVERLHSLRFEKKIKEGRYRADEVYEFDQENHQALYYSRKNQSKKKMFIAKDVLDELSAAYWFRLQPLKVGTPVHVPVSADEKNWDLIVSVLKKEKIKVGDLGEVEAFKLEPSAHFRGIFIRRGKIQGWISADEKRLPLMMKTKIPVLGTITIVWVSSEG